MTSLAYGKQKLSRLATYTTGIVAGLFTILAVELVLSAVIHMPFDKGQQILFFAMISFFALVRSILCLNIDLTNGPRIKWKLFASFVGWSIISFAAGFYASIEAVKVIDETVFPVIDTLARIWKAYILFFLTAANFVSATFMFHKIVNAVQIDTIEWFKRGFGDEGIDPPRANLAPVAKKILLGLIAQLAFNFVIYAVYGTPEAFFGQMQVYVQGIFSYFGIAFPVFA
ncbi:MAG: hypothetical protein GYA24_25470 [Candidatus Lokiarchaeota archaeon]|nr:hypothetical protein [Candidatus Lokiarchaeota archaeon]